MNRFPMLQLPTFLLVIFSVSVAPSQSPSPVSPTKIIFTDVTQESGITWSQFSGESPDRFLIETMGGGVGFLDFDGDGRQDIFLVNGGETPNGKSPVPVRNALYRNLPNSKFQDVAAQAGVDRINFYGMGVAIADYDNNGFPDLFITGYPECALFHNNGNGTFTDVTIHAGVKNSGKWAAGAAWFDYDRDGLLDLVVTNYTEFSFNDPKKCEIKGVRSYCAQVAYKGMPLTLYHNNGDGTFTDVSARSGFDKLIGRGLGVVTIDFNDDGWPDLFVARDASPNLLLINAKDGTFKDAALDAEVAYDASGNAKAGMGVDASDVNGDGVPDLVITNFNDQYHSLFFGSATFPYEEGTVASHLAQFSKADVGWGTKFLDYDNDGNLDLIMANGHINQSIESIRGDVKYLQPPLLLHNDGKAVFRNVRQEAGPAFNSSYVARGLAIGDFDNDGDSDVVITRLNATPLLLRNNVGQDSGWIGFELQGTKSNRDAIGAKIVVTIGNRRIVRWIVGGSSYLSSSDKRVLVGLGHTPKSSTVDAEIRWPSGALQNASNLEPNRYHKIVEGPSN
jgi:hypothetical protein